MSGPNGHPAGSGFPVIDGIPTNAWPNINVMDPSDPHADVVIKALTEGLDYSNRAYVLSQQGRNTEAVPLHRRALALKIAAWGGMSTQAGVSLNALGECLLKAGQLREAQEMLERALQIRDDKDAGGAEEGPRNDAAATRDNLARVYEANGDFEAARKIRLRGADKGETMCGSEDCLISGGAMLTRADLKACGACRSVFYCSETCQRRDWKSRHKPLCQAHTAARTQTTTA